MGHGNMSVEARAQRLIKYSIKSKYCRAIGPYRQLMAAHISECIFLLSGSSPGSADTPPDDLATIRSDCQEFVSFYFF